MKECIVSYALEEESQPARQRIKRVLKKKIRREGKKQIAVALQQMDAEWDDLVNEGV